MRPSNSFIFALFLSLFGFLSLFYFAFLGPPTVDSLSVSLKPSSKRRIQARDSQSTKWKQCVKKAYSGFPNVDFYETRPVVVYTWHSLENFLYIDEEAVRQCEQPCFFASEFDVDNPACSDEIDAFVFNPPMESLRNTLPKRRLKGQYWVLFCTETEDSWPQLLDTVYMRQFDINMTYHLDSDVPISYFISADMYTSRFVVQPKRKDVWVSAFISNCDKTWVHTNRGKILSELMEFLPVHSYGTCLNNRHTPREMHSWPMWQSKWNLSSTYMFTVAMENTIREDYVTEKLFHPFVVGSVPLYLGAPNVARFLPGEPSIVNIADFSTTKELANFITFLANNDKEYENYLQWKHDGPSKSFIALDAFSPRSAPCRLCKKIHELRMKESG